MRRRWPISECLHEVKLIVDLVYEGKGRQHELVDLQHCRISAAEYVTGPRIVDGFETKKSR